MKYQTLLFIIIGILIVLGFISLLVILISDKKRNFAGNAAKFILSIMFIIVNLLLINENSLRNYSLMSFLYECEVLNVPQIDSTMYLSRSDSKNMSFYSFSRDSIVHSSKLIEFDLFSTYKITDEVDNIKENLRLQLNYYKKSLIRKEKQVNIIFKKVDYNYIVVDTISDKCKDSILNAWGIYNKLYQRNLWGF